MPSQLRYSELLRYEPEFGLIEVYDQSQHPLDSLSLRLTDAQTTLAALEGTVLFDPMLRALVAAWSLVQVARTDAPKLESWAEQLRSRCAEPLILSLLDRVVQCANQAIAANKPIEPALRQFISQQIRSADRVAERCGRQANDLILDEDHVLVFGPLGLAGNWLLHSALRVEHKPFYLHGHTLDSPLVSSYTQTYARELAVPLGDTVSTIERDQFALLLLNVPYLLKDGSALVPQGTRLIVEQARQVATPCYVLAYDGPQVPLHHYTPAYEVLPAQLINAIITSRGMYRPSRINDYQDDADAPLDVISLS